MGKEKFEINEILKLENCLVSSFLRQKPGNTKLFLLRLHSLESAIMSSLVARYDLSFQFTSALFKVPFHNYLHNSPLNRNKQIPGLNILWKVFARMSQCLILCSQILWHQEIINLDI